MSGTLATNDRAPLPCQVILELPFRLRIETSEGVVAFDGEKSSTTKGGLHADDQKLLESTLWDTADRFLYSQVEGVAMRLLGTRFRMDDGTDPKYEGPYYDVYQVEEPVGLVKGGELKSKRFYFNSSTRLLEKVRYQENGAGIEIQIGGWQKINNQNVPGFIRRIEDKEQKFVLSVMPTAIGPREDDRIFSW
jgi:hypothetical protein